MQLYGCLKSPKLLTLEITIQEVHKTSGGLACFTEFKLEILTYYYYSYPMGFCNFQDSPHFKKHLFMHIQMMHSLSKLERASLLAPGPGRPCLCRASHDGAQQTLTWALQSFHWELSHQLPPPETHSMLEPHTTVTQSSPASVAAYSSG